MGPWLAPIAAFLSRMIQSRIGFWVLSGLAFFGLQWGATQLVVGPLLAQIQSAFVGLPADLIAWLSFLNIDRYVTIVLSAYATAAGASALRLRRKP